jgi:High potential iron-sulfur protein
MKSSRRGFLVYGVVMGSSLALPGIASADAPRLSEDDPAAKAVGYREDATKVDKARSPSYAAGQNCRSCSLFQGKASDAWGGCMLFGTKQVAAQGWCSSYGTL